MKRLWTIVLALLLTIPLAVPSAAHKQKVTITTVEHNPRTGLLEVVHHIPLHDAEHTLRVQGMTAPDIIEDTETRRAFARYVAERFTITVENEPIQLVVLGSEIDGGNLLVYQEAPSPGTGAKLSVRSLIFTDIWAKQINRVNVGRATSPTTLIFRVGDAAKSAVLK